MHWRSCFYYTFAELSLFQRIIYIYVYNCRDNRYIYIYIFFLLTVLNMTIKEVYVYSRQLFNNYYYYDYINVKRFGKLYTQANRLYAHAAYFCV